MLAIPSAMTELQVDSPGQYVKLQATISGLTGLVDGMYDQWEEQAVYLIGGVTSGTLEEQE